MHACTYPLNHPFAPRHAQTYQEKGDAADMYRTKLAAAEDRLTLAAERLALAEADKADGIRALQVPPALPLSSPAFLIASRALQERDREIERLTAAAAAAALDTQELATSRLEVPTATLQQLSPRV